MKSMQACVDCRLSAPALQCHPSLHILRLKLLENMLRLNTLPRCLCNRNGAASATCVIHLQSACVCGGTIGLDATKNCRWPWCGPVGSGFAPRCQPGCAITRPTWEGADRLAFHVIGCRRW